MENISFAVHFSFLKTFKHISGDADPFYMKTVDTVGARI